MKPNIMYMGKTPIILNDTPERNPLECMGFLNNVNVQTVKNLKNSIFGNTAFNIFKTESQKKKDYLIDIKKRYSLRFTPDMDKEERRYDFQILKEHFEYYLTGRIREYDENRNVKIFYANDFHRYEHYFKPAKIA